MNDPIALAVPLFLLAMGAEAVVASFKGRRLYRLTDAITDLSCGITSQVLLIFGTAAQLAIYAWLFEHARLLTLGSGWVAWLVAFVGVDLAYYAWHRYSHEINFLWASHVVHHQSEDFNLAVALRQSVLTSWTALPFYLPLAIAGVPTLVFAIVHALSMLYQFWIHTELVGRVRGPLDWVLNLPSHHRVHHAVNPEYLDKNYGGTLIVWDRLFGTYAPEIAPPVYGITHPLRSFNPLWAQVHYWFELVAMTRAARGPGEKIRVWLASPAWKPAAFVLPASEPLERRSKYDRELSRSLRLYLTLSYVSVVGVAFCLLMWHGTLTRSVLFVACAAILGGVVALGGLIERKRWAVPAEISRLVLTAAALVLWLRP